MTDDLTRSLFGDDPDPTPWDPTNTACHYARNKILVIDLIDKKPWRLGWPTLASRNISDVVQMFDQAINRIGSVERIRVGWALGRDGNIAIDIDTPELIDPELQAVLDA